MLGLFGALLVALGAVMPLAYEQHGPAIVHYFALVWPQAGVTLAVGCAGIALIALSYAPPAIRVLTASAMAAVGIFGKVYSDRFADWLFDPCRRTDCSAYTRVNPLDIQPSIAFTATSAGALLLVAAGILLAVSVLVDIRVERAPRPRRDPVWL